MPDSPTNDHSHAQNDQTENTKKRICDFCSESVALLYCRADSAKLCLSCDREVHSTNPLFTKHTRFQLCDACDAAPATILCFTEHSVLCQNCDYELHNLPGSSAHHDRRPLEGFTGCPSVIELSGFVGFEGFDCKDLLVSDQGGDQGFGGVLLNELLDEENDEFSDYLVWDTPTVVSLDDLIVPSDRSHSYQAMGVPSLPKDRNLSCGQQKQEILRQLCELSKLEPIIKQDSDTLFDHHCVADEDHKYIRIQGNIQPYHNDEMHPTFGANEARAYTWGNDTAEAVNDIFLSSSLSESHVEESVLNSDTHSGICNSANLATNGLTSQLSMGTESQGLPPKVSAHEFTTADRDSAISRYKEKKRTRRFDKHIRYESRKLQAENRIRVKGRFAKTDSRMNQI